MTERCAVRGGSTRRTGGAWRLGLRLVLLCLLAAILAGCRSGAPKDTATETRAEARAPEAVEALPADANSMDGLDAKITIENPVVDLGEVGTDSRVSGKFTFTSNGKGTLKILRVHSCCGVATRGVEAGQEYAPGESGVLEFDYATGATPLKGVRRDLRFQTNDPNQEFVTFTIKADIVRRIAVDPTRLRLFLNQDNAGCGEITVRSLDGKPFSITSFMATANSISADFDPNAVATEFVIRPKANMEALERNVRGVIGINLTHPECGNVRVPYDVLPEFTINPAFLMVFNMRPGQPVQREVWVLSNYRDEFDVESVSSQKGYVKLVEKKMVDSRCLLRIEIIPPAPDGDKSTPAAPQGGQDTAPAAGPNENVMVTDVLEVKIKDGDTISIPIRGFYLVE